VTSSDGVDAVAAGLLERLALDADVGIAILDVDGRYLFVNKAMADATGRTLTGHHGRSIVEIAGPQAGSVLVELIGGVRRTGRAVNDVSVKLGERSWEGTLRPLNVDGLWAIGVIARDVTDRDAAVEELRRRAAQRSVVAALSQGALEINDLNLLFDETVRLLARDLDAELIKVLELLPSGAGLCVRADIGWSDPDSDTPLEIPADESSHVGYALSADAPAVLDDLETDERFKGSALLVERGVRSGVAVKIQGRLGIWGVLAVHTTRQRTFTQADVQLVTEIATLLAAAVERRRAEEELERVAVQRRLLVKEALEAAERERLRIADLLHEEVLQNLLFALQECKSAFATGSDPSLGRTIRGLEEAVTQLRAAVSELHPLSVPNRDLGATIRALADDQAERSGCPVTVEVSESADSRHDQLVTSAVRELLANVAKHAPGAHGSVRIGTSGADLHVEVADDGPGFDPAAVEHAVSKGHVGLASLFARVEASGGNAELMVVGGEAGARVRFTLPLP
jgi:PAS domain S-box-containing protein